MSLDKQQNFAIRYKMEEMVDFIVRNYEELPEEHKNKNVLYSVSTSLLSHLINSELKEKVDAERLFQHLIKASIKSHYSRIGLFTLYTSPGTGLETIIPNEVTSNLTDMPLNTLDEIMKRQQTKEELTLKLDGSVINEIQAQENMTEEQVLKQVLEQSDLWLYVKLDYAKELLEYDEKKIREELERYEKTLRVNLKETGVVPCPTRKSLRF